MLIARATVCVRGVSSFGRLKMQTNMWLGVILYVEEVSAKGPLRMQSFCVAAISTECLQLD